MVKIDNIQNCIGWQIVSFHSMMITLTSINVARFTKTSLMLSRSVITVACFKALILTYL